jgi:cytochrome P450
MTRRPRPERFRTDGAIPMLAQGYAWLPDRRRAAGGGTVHTRLMGRRALGVEGPEAARFVYDEDHVRRSGALPEPVVSTLFGHGAVHTLDGEPHRVGKAMFVDLLTGDGVGALVSSVTAAWDDAVRRWVGQRRVVLFDEAGRVLTRGVCDWAGVPVSDEEVPALARDLTALVDGFATAFAHEVRRFYPFAPFIGGRTPRAVEWEGEQIPAGSMVLLDLFGQNRDPELWEEPYAFHPEGFLDRSTGAWELVPKGAGDPRTGHRCPGEDITVALLSALVVRLARLARLEYVLPPQDLPISLRRIPARPASRVVLTGVRPG